jgi:LPXTG-site transpeptidase (sortase) family protein
VTQEPAEAATVEVEEPRELNVKEFSEEPVVEKPKPIKIIFDSLDKEIVILNPDESTIAAMDEALLDGVVRHPDSADFERTGNMLLLGHSSYLPNILNKNFQAFNGIQKMTWGDKVRLQSGDTEYVYRVERVREEKASEVVVPYDWGESRLTMVTCNSFGSKEDRYIVEAELIGQYAI